MNIVGSPAWSNVMVDQTRIATINGPQQEKTCLQGFANNTGADQPAHPRSLISAFVIRFLVSINVNLLQVNFHFFWLVSVAEETGMKHALSEPPKTGFLRTRPKWWWSGR